jgi:hypothetical protein
MYSDTALALKVLIFLGIPFIAFFIFMGKVYPKMADRRDFKSFFGFAYNCFNVESLVQERIKIIEMEAKNLLINTTEIFKPSDTVDIPNVSIELLLNIWKEETKIIEQKAKELERAKLFAQKFGFKNEQFLLSKSLD